MARVSLACTLGLAACAGHGGGGNDGGGERSPFTNGVSTLAGWSDAGYLDGSRDVNLFHNPTGVAYGPDGKIYVADFDNDKLRAVDADGNATTVFAKKGFARPFSLLFVGNTLYVMTDMDPNGVKNLMSGTIWTVDIASQTATPVATAIGRPRGMAALDDGRLALTDYDHHVIEILDPRTRVVTRIAGMWDAKGYADGGGTTARFSTPYALVQRADGTLIVTDFDNSKLRLVTLDGTVTTLAGNAAGFADGAMASAKFDHPQAMVQMPGGDIYVTDLHNFRIRKVSGTTVTTVAGDGNGGYMDDDNPLAAEIYGLEGVTAKPDGSMLYLADGTRGESAPYNRIRQINLAAE